MKENNPLSPHIQIYNWHISSLISISHRITGIINIILITLICLWTALLLLGDINYELIQKFFETFFGKFLIMGTVWSFSFQILSEIRHLFWDLGLGFELKTSNITGLLVIFGSFVLTILIFTLGSSVILMPLMLWFLFNLVSYYDKSYDEVLLFFTSQPTKFLFSLFIIFAYFYSSLSISEVFEDYIESEKLKYVANRLLYLFAIIIPISTLLLLFKLSL